MSYGNVEEEMKRYQLSLKLSENTLSKLSLFFKDIGKNGVKFIEKEQKLLEEFFNELKKEDGSTTLNISITNIYNEYISFFSKMKENFVKLEKNFGDKVEEYLKKYKISNKENLTKLSLINGKINAKKGQLDKAKNSYFDSAKDSVDFEKKMNKEYAGLEKRKDPKANDEICKITQKRIKFKEALEEKKGSYQKEVKTFNLLIDNLETEYSGVKALFQNNQNNKILFYIEIMNDLNKMLKNKQESYDETLKKMNKYKDDINPRRDLKLFEYDHNFLNTSTKKRFLKENFLNYELRKKSGVKSSGKADNNDNLNEEEQDNKYMTALQILSLGNDEFLDYNSLNENDIELDKLITSLITSEKEIEENINVRLMQSYRIDNSSTRKFVYLLVNHFCRKEFVLFYSLENFNILNNILCEIISICNEKEELFELIFFVLFISTKTIYFNKQTNKVENFLCEEMQKDKIFSSYKFWSDLMNKRVDLIAEVEITKEIDKIKENTGKENILNQALGKIGKFGKIFGIGGNDNKKIEKEILRNQFFEKNSPQFCDKVINEYLLLFINFKYYGTEPEKLIEEISNNYKLLNEYKLYYSKVIKYNKKIYDISKEWKKIDIKDENFDAFYFSYKREKKFKGINDNKIKCLIFSLRYLDVKEYPKIIALNKSLSSQMKKIIYKNILLKYKNIDIKTHLKIWKVLLNYSEIKKNNDYKKILEEANKAPDQVKSYDIIKLDVVRTAFSVDEPKKREQIENMLKAIAKELPNLNYCQGMNHIASFFLDICDGDEEEGFYLFFCLMKDSDYSNLFKDELAKLNLLFYQFERIMCITFPEIYTYLKKNNITPGYYISPWFITLFTDAFIDDPKDNNKEVIMKIIDTFIIGGWKGIIRVGMSLIKNNESKIMNTPIEELLNYLTCEIIKTKYFDKNNSAEIMKAYLKYKINGEMLAETESQYMMKKSLTKLE